MEIEDIEVSKKDEAKKTLFEIEKKKLELEIKKIEELNSTTINWYDLKSEVEKIKLLPTYEEESILLYEFQKKFIDSNKSMIKGYDKDIVIFKVLEELINKDGLNIGAIQLKQKNYFVDSGVNNAVIKALKVLELYEVVIKQTIGDNNEKGYSLNLDKWFNKSRYKIQDYVVLEKLAPIITSFINIGFIDEFNIEKLFDRLSDIIEYAILPSVLHNKYLDIENIITTAIIDKEEIEILINGKNKNITPIKIVFADGTKYIIYQIGSITERVEVYKCSPIEAINYIDFKPINVNQSMYMTEDVEDNQPLKPKEINLLLECDSVIYEYFKMLPLSNMTIYDSEEKQIEFMKKYNYDCMPNKFYIEAFDLKEKIISVIFHCLENVKIITPTDLNDDIIGRMKSFARKNKIDICEEDTPPQKPKTPNVNTTSQDTKNEKKENIDTTGVVKKIKEDKSDNFDF